MSHCSRQITVGNRRGLHARASAKFVNMVHSLPATVEVEKDGNRVTGTSIMGLMMLGAAKGDRVTIHVEGDEAEAHLAQLVELIETKFGEE
ncbi:MAG TPA: HPr family phosphocarrier protein [Sphingomicrobium sp.]|nr:HPr family phosphocarrier protein [Sphingomicrobium sp.]